MSINISITLLSGKTILVTRAVGQSSELSQGLTNLGARVIELPALEIGPPSSWMFLDQSILELSTFDWLVFTSTNGVEYFFERMALQNKNQQALIKEAINRIKIAVVGEKTAQSLKTHHLEPDFIPPDFIADSLVNNFPENLAGKKILFPRVESGGREILVKELTQKGAQVVEVPAYESLCPQSIPTTAQQVLINQSVDVITFASSKTVKFFCVLLENNLPQEIEHYLKKTAIASIGPQTSKTCIDLLGRVDITTQQYTIDGLIKAIVEWSLRR
ncbi:uroporphyrinogen-III synthase [Cylindrospermopsis raciborskii]|uniref:uroporphyrinogen-III synthase n=1 Tax=Cylindrospermopsis raciborskii TaxID=77022 RepID=UPI001FD29C53|nr:uroporphyrinogen-III synthase [Cylindrospermopsis raciborskii]